MHRDDKDKNTLLTYINYVFSGACCLFTQSSKSKHLLEKLTSSCFFKKNKKIMIIMTISPSRLFTSLYTFSSKMKSIAIYKNLIIFTSLFSMTREKRWFWKNCVCDISKTEKLLLYKNLHQVIHSNTCYSYVN